MVRAMKRHDRIEDGPEAATTRTRVTPSPGYCRACGVLRSSSDNRWLGVPVRLRGGGEAAGARGAVATTHKKKVKSVYCRVCVE
jgi:hypothetical protein